MAEKTGQEVQEGLKKGIRTGVSAAHSVKTVQKAAAKAASGNYAGAALDVLKDENTRKVIAIVLLASLFLTIIIFFIAPLTLYETISQAAKEIGEKWSVAYYSGTSGRFISFFKAFGALFTDPDAGTEDQATEDDLKVMEGKEELRSTYVRKIQACQDKINARQELVLDKIKTGTIASVMASRFEAEEAHRYDDNDYVRMQFDGTEIISTTRSITPRQAIQILSLYSTQINSSIENIKLSGLLKWLGYNAGGQRKIQFPLGDNSGTTYTINAWKGTFMPQYLIDEASAAGKLEEYQDKYGCSVADFVIKVECPDLYSIQAIESEEMITETEVYYTDLTYYYRDYDVPKTEKPIYDRYGNIVIMQGPYHYEWSDVFQRYLAVRDADAPQATYTIKSFVYSVRRERQVDIRVIHIKYMVPIQVTTRSVDELVEMTGMWSGWLPSEPPYQSGGKAA